MTSPTEDRIFRADMTGMGDRLAVVGRATATPQREKAPTAAPVAVRRPKEYSAPKKNPKPVQTGRGGSIGDEEFLRRYEAGKRLGEGSMGEVLMMRDQRILRDVDALTEAGLPMIVYPGHRGGIELGFDYRTGLTGLAADEARIRSLVSETPAETPPAFSEECPVPTGL